MDAKQTLIQEALKAQAAFLTLMWNHDFTYEEFEQYVIDREREIQRFESFAPILAPGEYFNNRDKVPNAKIQAQMARKYLELFQLMGQFAEDVNEQRAKLEG